MQISSTARIAGAAVAAAAALAASAQAKLDDPAASHYTPRALKALGLQWEAKANAFGKRSLSQQKRKSNVPVQAPVSAAPAAGAGCNAQDELCPSKPTAPADDCWWDEESGGCGAPPAPIAPPAAETPSPASDVFRECDFSDVGC